MTTSTDHLIWHSAKAEPNRYSNDVGGDNQLSDVWFVRLFNLDNYSTVDISVYVAGFPGDGTGEFEQAGIEVCLEWSEWLDADHESEGYADISYEPGNALAYPADDESIHDLFERECKNIAMGYIRNAERDIWWDGHSAIIG